MRYNMEAESFDWIEDALSAVHESLIQGYCVEVQKHGDKYLVVSYEVI